MTHSQTKPVTTALLLAAGTGSRLYPLTQDAPKCLTEINQISIVERLIHALCQNGIQRLIVVVGHLGQCIRDYLDSMPMGLTVEYIVNDKFRTTNNIYSLWLARNIIQEPFLLVECDLVFEPDLLEDMLLPDRIAVSQRLPWMNGSTVTLDLFNHVTALHVGKDLPVDYQSFKTVNIYSFSLSSWQHITKRLDQHVDGSRVAAYYEMVLAELILEHSISLQAVFFDEQRWYEVDTLEDLREAERLFVAPHDDSTPICV
jgi:choline kinase